MKKLKKFVEKLASANNAKDIKVKIIWNFFDNKKDFVKIAKNEKNLYKFKKKENFNDLNIVVKENNNYDNMKYK